MENDLSLNISTKGAEDAANKIRGVKDNLASTGGATSDLSDKLTKAGLAIGAVGIGLTAYSKSATNSYTDYVKATNSISRITGEAVDQTSRLQYVFSRSGISADQSATVFGTLQKQIAKNNEVTGEAADKQADLNNKIEAARIKIKELSDDTAKNGDASGKNKNQIDALNISIKGYQDSLNEAITPLQKLGVQTQDSTGKARSFSDILLDISDKFKSMPNGAEKTALSMQLFGRQGKDLIPVLNKGSEGIKDLEAQADKLGLTLSTTNVDAVAKYTEAHKKVKDAQTAFTLAVGQEALPMYQKLADAQVWATQQFRDAPAPIKETVTAIAAFGGPVLTAAGSITTFAANVSSINWGGVATGFSNVGKGIKGGVSLLGTMGSSLMTNIRVMALFALESAKSMIATTVSIAKATGAIIAQGAAAAVAGARWAIFNAAQLAVRAGAIVMTAAQWALNAAMAANPIGLIIIALIALAAGLVMLWTHSETFRNIVTGAFNAVWGAIQAVWGWISANWPLLLAILTGPIGIAVYMIVSHWETIKAAFALAWAFIQSVWAGVAGWFAGVWAGIVAVFSAVGGFFYNVFASAWNGIVGIFGGLGNFFRGVYNGIVGIFGSIGAAVGNGIAGAVKGVVNSILSGAENIINGFINAINGAINTINKIPGVNIGKLGGLHLPRLAEGGIVSAQPGGRAVIVGEGGEDEAVIPLSKLDRIINNSQNGGGNGGGNRTTTIQNVYLGSADAVREFYKSLDNDTLLTNNGFTPQRGNA